MLSQTVDGAKLRRTRETARMSVAALAEHAGCTIWHVYGIETGRWQPSGEVYDGIVDALTKALPGHDVDLLIEEGGAA
jgi:predicted transcriptional regulator